MPADNLKPTGRDRGRVRRRRPPGRLAVIAAVLALTACGVDPGHQSVAVGSAAATAPATDTAPLAGRSPSKVAAASPATCRPAQLRADQVPLSSGTGRSYLAWSLTNTGPAPCTLRPGAPTLAFVDAAGAAIVTFAAVPLAPAPAASPAVTVAPDHAAWFLTEESTADCGTGTVVGGGPFRYTVHLPGGVGAVTWTAPYLSGPDLHDFCGSVTLAVGALQVREPAV